MDQISKAADFIANLRFALRQEPQIPETFRPENIASGYAVQIVADFGALGTVEVSFC